MDIVVLLANQEHRHRHMILAGWSYKLAKRIKPEKEDDQQSTTARSIPVIFQFLLAIFTRQFFSFVRKKCQTSINGMHFKPFTSRLLLHIRPIHVVF
jgi:hypothetical protein